MIKLRDFKPKNKNLVNTSRNNKRIINKNIISHANVQVSKLY